MDAGRRFVRHAAGAAIALLAVACPLHAFGQEASPGVDPLAQPPIAPSENVPPPILPAPDLPIEDPLVELPPKGAAQTPAAVQAPVFPGIPTNAAGKPFSFADLAEELLDSVVYISTQQRVSIAPTMPLPTPPKPKDDDFFEDFFDNQTERNGDAPRMVQSLGSGFVVEASGLIVTNNHVISDADEIVANFANGSKLTARIVGIDDKTDLALLQVQPKSPLKAAKFGRSEIMRVGDWVLAIGNPFGFGGTVTAGIVSALDRDINSGPYDHYIQTDASINRGNSGGPLFNINGEVVGINTAIMSPTGGSIGIGFAVPTEVAVPVIEQLRAFGEVRRGWIGVRIQEVNEDTAKSIGIDENKGALIAGLTTDGPAAKAGILAGDVVIEFNGKSVQSMRSLPRLVADVPPGEVAQAIVMRNGKRVTLSVEVGLLNDVKEVKASRSDAKPAEPDANVLANPFGLNLGPITEESRRSYSIANDVSGVLVTGVAKGSEAEEKSVKAGDVIVQVSQQAVSQPEDVASRLKELKAEGRRTALLLVSGPENKLRFVSLRLEDAP